MRKVSYFTVLLFLTLTISSCERPTPPNIIYILADDLGYGELGVHGQEIIETPHIDALARTGMRFTQHYSGSAVCAPSRSVLLTGMHSGHTHIRGNDEWRERGDVWDYAAMFQDSSLEGQRPLLDSIVTIAEILKEAGYTTGSVGKWGLGAPGTEGVPTKQGFDFFYGYNCQRQAHTYYPMHLWRNEERELLNNKMIAPHSQLPPGADPLNPESYKDFSLNDYAPELMHKEALTFIENNSNSPFFLYYASPIPHVALQAPKRWVDYYIDKLGPEKPYIGDNNFPYFPNFTPRATYAGMISYLDEQVGEIVTKLKELNIYENTLIIFTSDNGPTHSAGGADTRYFSSAKPFRTSKGWTKGSLNEGGIRVPMIVTWPGHIAAGSTSDHISSFYDVMPTLYDVIGQPISISTDGISFFPTLIGKPQISEHEYLYWEFPGYNGQQAVRMGNWKGIRKDIFDGNLNLKLYNLKDDIRESHDVAPDNPAIVRKIESIMKEEHVPSSIERFKFSQLGDN
tara:strand:- start:30 stop:1565 length:1536 start_codon:yes stop_codon:yes gene_type:complete